jgi:WD40 repeat protein
MRTRFFQSLSIILLASSVANADAVNYQDHILPIFRDACLNCHNPDKKKAGLDLSTFQTAMAGSNNGPVINAGDPDGSMLYKAVTHAEEPTMPPKRDKLPQKELDLIKNWIASGALETKNGKPIASAKPKVNLGVANLTIKRPEGPPPMPRDFSLEPAVHASRAWAINCMAASPWAPVVAVGSQHEVLLYNPQTFDLLGVVPFSDGEPCVTRFSRNGKMLLIGGGVAAKSGKVSLWDITTGKHVTDVGNEFDEVIAADISPDQTAVALGGPSKVLKVYSTQDGSGIASVKKHTDWITAIAYSPDGVLLASADRAGGLWVWEAKTAREFYNLAGHKAGITALAFRDDSNFLASASEDGTIKLWDMEQGKNVKTWNAHGGGVLSLAFTHDGRLVSSGRDRVVKLWKPDGSQIKQLDAFNDIALQATFDDDGKRVIAADWTGDIRVWDADKFKLLGHLDPNPPNIADRIAAAEKKLADLAPAHEKAMAQLTPLQEAVNKADRDIKEAQAALAKAEKSRQEAQATLERAKVGTDAVESQRTALAAELSQLKAGQFFQKVLAARNELSAKQSDQEQAKAALAAAEADVQKTTVAIAAAEKAHTDGPSRLASAKEQLSKAADLVSSANAGAKIAQTIVDQKQSILTAAKELSDRLASEASKSTDNKILADAASKSKAAFDALAADLDNAKKASASKAEAVTAASTALAASQSNLDKLQKEIDQSPATLASLHQSQEKATQELSKSRESLEEAEQALAKARKAADELNAQYQQMAHPAQLSEVTK